MQVTGPKMKIRVRETMIAIDKMGKNKAAAADELLDIIFQVKEWKDLVKNLKKEQKMRSNWKQEMFNRPEGREDDNNMP